MCETKGEQLAAQPKEAFGPARGHISERQRVQVTALNVYTTVGHQIRFHKTGSGLLPLLERTDRNLLLEQRSRSRAGETALASFALGTQETIRCRRAHRKNARLLCSLNPPSMFASFGNSLCKTPLPR